MSIWAEIKHALNSTLGTPNFKPLDKAILLGGKRFVASNNLYYKFDKQASAGTTTVTVQEFTANISGTIRFGAKIYQNSGNYTTYLTIKRNGTAIHTFNAYLSGGSAEQFITFNVNENDKFSFELYSDGSDTDFPYPAICSYIALYADVINVPEISF